MPERPDSPAEADLRDRLHNVFARAGLRGTYPHTELDSAITMLFKVIHGRTESFYEAAREMEREPSSPFQKAGEDPAAEEQIKDALRECHRYNIDQHGEGYPPEGSLRVFLRWIREICQPVVTELEEEYGDGE